MARQIVRGKVHFHMEADFSEHRLIENFVMLLCHCEVVCKVEESNHCPVQELKLTLTPEVVTTG